MSGSEPTGAGKGSTRASRLIGGAGGLLRATGRALKPLMYAAAEAFASLVERATTFRRLKAVAEDGWAISTYGMLVLPDAHQAAAEALGDRARASALLEEGWSRPEAQTRPCSVLPFVYPAEDRAVAVRRQELLLRASERYAAGHFAESVLLVYSQLDGIFQDFADHGGEQAFARLFSRTPASVTPDVRQFELITVGSGTMLATEHEFFLGVRELMSASVRATTLEDHPSRHGILHGRVLGYDTRLRAAQAFAFLAAALELLVASAGDRFLLADERCPSTAMDLSPGLAFIGEARMFAPVRTVYLALPGDAPPLQVSVPDDVDAGRPFRAT